MVSVDGSSSALSSCSSRASGSSRISPITRIRHARLVHEQLQQQRKWSKSNNSRSRTHRDQGDEESSGEGEDDDSDPEPAVMALDMEVRCPPSPPPRTPGSTAIRKSHVESLAKELQKLLRREPAATSSLSKRVEKIGSHEKDALVVHLLQQVASLQSQRNDVVAVGEKLTTRLVQQQHELRVEFQTQTSHFHEQLHEALHRPHPEIALLEEQVAQLQAANRQFEQKLLFAAQKLHRSRQRERALRMEQESDPLLWNL